MTDLDREALAREHMYLVDSLTRAESRRLGKDVDRDELRSFALLGLAQAIDRYDEERGAAFTTYAVPRIRGAIYDGLSKAGWFPRRLHRKIAFYRQATELVEARAEGQEPTTDAEVAQEIADTLKELAVAYVTTWSGAEYQPMSKDEGALDAESLLAEQQYLAQVRLAVDRLPERQAQLVRGVYWQGRPLLDLAGELGITKSWASKLLSGALDTLHRRLELIDRTP